MVLLLDLAQIRKILNKKIVQAKHLAFKDAKKVISKN